MRQVVFIFLLLYCGLSMAQEKNISVYAALSDSSIKIGEQTKYTIKINIPSAGKKPTITWPEFTDTIIGPVEIIEKENSENTQLLSRTWIITSFDSGYHALPPAEVYVDTAKYESNAVLLEVHTVEVDTTKAFKDIKDIIGAAAPVNNKTESKISYWWYAGAGALMLALVLFILLRKKKKAPVAPPPPPLPLHAYCLKKLDEIEAQQYWQNNQVKQYYTEVTDVVREYISKRFKIKAFELTSHQLLHQLRIGGIAEVVHLPLKELFSLADMAKFAKVKPDAHDNEAAITIARKFIVQTTPVQPEGENKP